SGSRCSNPSWCPSSCWARRHRLYGAGLHGEVLGDHRAGQLYVTDFDGDECADTVHAVIAGLRTGIGNRDNALLSNDRSQGGLETGADSRVTLQRTVVRGIHGDLRVGEISHVRGADSVDDLADDIGRAVVRRTDVHCSTV